MAWSEGDDMNTDSEGLDDAADGRVAPGDHCESPLSMSRAEMRRTGYAVVDALLDVMHQPDPVIQRADPGRMAMLLHTPCPEKALGMDEVLQRLVRDVFPYASKVGHPGYFAYIPGSTTWPSALAEFMASVWNVSCCSWMEAAGPSQLELTVLDWFREWIGMPEGSDGVLVSGGSAANLTALAAARELRLGPMSQDAVIYCADQAHSSVGRAARVLGFRSDQVHIIPSDDRFRLRPDALRAAVASDLAAGHRPLIVSAAAGSTNTGTVDPLHEIADLCAEFAVWLHVDAAYGGFAALTARGAVALDGIERADSVTLDPHKWLFQPIECGALLVREHGALERAFAVLPDYLADAESHGGEVNFSDRGLQLTRNARAVKVWASLSTFGVSAFREAIDRNLGLVDLAERLIEEDQQLQLMNPANLGIVCFRRRIVGLTEAQTARVNLWLVAALEATGRAMVSSTRLHGRLALRMCVLSHLTQEDDVRWTLEFLARTEIPGSVLDGDCPSELWNDVPLLSLLSPAGQQQLTDGSFRREFAAGSTIVSRWAIDRDFYVVLEGEVSVRRDGVVVGRLGPGDFFGEIAASDWGSGYGYVRTADVNADSDTAVLLVAAEVLSSLMASEPRLRARVLAARADRLTRL
jgi:aromatic-L-amino-acid/L-tryptophan decarboxylase